MSHLSNLHYKTECSYFESKYDLFPKKYFWRLLGVRTCWHFTTCHTHKLISVVQIAVSHNTEQSDVVYKIKIHPLVSPLCETQTCCHDKHPNTCSFSLLQLLLCQLSHQNTVLFVIITRADNN